MFVACPAAAFFFSSRRRHTRFKCDWSSDVCSSDLDLVVARPFPSAFTTIAFDYSRRRWFETCSCKPVPRGLPSSVKQLRTTQRFLLSCSWHTLVTQPDRQPSRFITVISGVSF